MNKLTHIPSLRFLNSVKVMEVSKAATTVVSCEQALLQLCHCELKIIFENMYIIYLFLWLKLGYSYLFLNSFKRFILQENSLRHYDVGAYLAALTLVLWYLIH